MNKRDLNETEVCQNFITPAIVAAGYARAWRWSVKADGISHLDA